MSVTPERLLRWNRPGPRYTSYPTAPQWTADLPERAVSDALAGLRSPCSVYVHIPFCREQCSFCGCNMVVAGRREPGTRYLDALERQIDTLALPNDTADVARIHLGGGTPTWLSPAELERLFGMLYRRFRRVPGAEISVEADPEVTTDEHVDMLASLGVNRLSMGVQSFDPVVLEAVNRPQAQSRVSDVLARARMHGMYSLNLDLMYGLPHQDEASLADTLARTLEMRPDRLAVFGYAHVPWMKTHMKKLAVDALPSPEVRANSMMLVHDTLVAQGYQAVGFDHFALVDDELAVAQREKRLHRNFMGYTTRPDLDLVGLGMSAISEVGRTFSQQKSKLSHWWHAVEHGEPVVEKGLVMTDDDLVRRDVINGLMCNYELPYAAFDRQHGFAFRERFRAELDALAPLVDEGFVTIDDERVAITDDGRWFVRHVAMAFDAYLGKAGGRFSPTV